MALDRRAGVLGRGERGGNRPSEGADDDCHVQSSRSAVRVPIGGIHLAAA